MGKINSRRKGQTAERKLVKLFEAWWGEKFFRTPGSGAFATRGFLDMDLSNMAGDIVTTDKSFPFCVESKKVEGWTLEQMLTSDKTHMHKWWEQTVSETPEGKIPLLVFTKNHAPLYAMLRIDDMSSELLLKLHTHKGGCTTSFEVIMYGEEVEIFALEHLFSTNKEDWLS